MTTATNADISLIGWLLSAIAGVLLYAACYYFMFVRQRDSSQPEHSEYELLDRRAEVRLELSRARTEGVGIRNNGMRLEIDELDRWQSDVINWEQKVLAIIEGIDAADAEWFKTLDAVPKPRVSCNRIGASHIGTMAEHDYRLVRLEKLISKYAAS